MHSIQLLISLWPDNHEVVERERCEAKAKKRRAKERQEQEMEKLAKQRERFIKDSKIYTDQEGDPSRSSKFQKLGTSKDRAGDQLKSSANFRAAAEDKDQSQDSALTSQASALEYNCCICQNLTKTTEDRPIGLVTLIQSSSILAHKHESNNHLGILET